MELSEVYSREVFTEYPLNQDYHAMPLGRSQALNPLNAEESLDDNLTYGQQAMHSSSLDDNLVYWEIEESKQIGRLQTATESSPAYGDRTPANGKTTPAYRKKHVRKINSRTSIGQSQIPTERNPAYGKMRVNTNKSADALGQQSTRTLKMRSETRTLRAVAIAAFVVSCIALVITLTMFIVFLARGSSGVNLDELCSLKEEVRRLGEQLNHTKHR